MRGFLLAMAVLVAWCAVSALLAPFIGAFCALGSEPDPIRKRLDEVEADRLIDEAPELYV